jgi:hypothetical protein
MLLAIVLSPLGGLAIPHAIPTAHAVGYLLTLLRSYWQAPRGCPKTEMRAG